MICLPSLKPTSMAFFDQPNYVIAFPAECNWVNDLHHSLNTSLVGVDGLLAAAAAFNTQKQLVLDTHHCCVQINLFYSRTLPCAVCPVMP